MSKIINLSNSKIAQNKGVKYSEMLEEFMASFAKEFSAMEYIEDTIEFAIIAWNFGNMKSIMPQDEFERLTASTDQTDESIVFMHKLIDHKVSKYKKHTNFIVDYELKGSDKNPILSIITQEQDAYLSGMLDDFEDYTSPDDFQENYIDRIAIILKPQQPLMDWCKDLLPKNTDFIEEELKEVNIYLINDEIDDTEKWLKKKFDMFFMMELEEWSSNKKQWPQRRTYKMFKQWFRVEISNMVYDTEKKPVLKLV